MSNSPTNITGEGMVCFLGEGERTTQDFREIVLTLPLTLLLQVNC